MKSGCKHVSSTPRSSFKALAEPSEPSHAIAKLLEQGIALDGRLDGVDCSISWKAKVGVYWARYYQHTGIPQDTTFLRVVCVIRCTKPFGELTAAIMSLQS